MLQYKTVQSKREQKNNIIFLIILKETKYGKVVSPKVYIFLILRKITKKLQMIYKAKKIKIRERGV